MKIGILGSGNVGQALAKGFVEEGHEVYLATRDPEADKAQQLKQDIAGVNVCNYETAATQGELVVLCAPWDATADVMQLSNPSNLVGKVVIDTNNAVSHSSVGVELLLGFNDSAGETVQRWLSSSKVVKCFNTVGAVNMYKPDFGGVTPTMFMAGNDADAKAQVATLVTSFGWEPLDAGDITAARLLEPMAVLWINHAMSSGEPHHAYKLL